MASLNELHTVYGLRDLYDILEINAVERHNANEAMKPEGR